MNMTFILGAFGIYILIGLCVASDAERDDRPSDFFDYLFVAICWPFLLIRGILP